MPNLIKLKCGCGRVFGVDFHPDIRSKSFRCPSCKQLASFSEYTIEDDGMADSHIGSIVFDGQRFQLREGHNLVGRECSNNIASIVLPIKQKRTSRKHIDIRVSRIPMKGYVHLLSIAAIGDFNETRINSLVLHHGDVIILNDGDRIFLPDHELEFENRQV